MTRPRVAVAHDYLTQRGGAERVVLSLLRAFPDATLHTLLYDADATYPEFRDARIVTSALDRVGRFRRDPRFALPLLAPVASRFRVDADVVVASTSGWAHGFAATGRVLAYCHNPARWVYQTDEYLGRPARTSPVGLPLLAARPMLRAWDRRAARRVSRYLANARVVADRIQRAYGVEAAVVPAPVSMRTDAERQPVPALADTSGLHLLVSRLLPYKNVGAAIEAYRGTEHHLVVVGRGPEEQRLRDLLPPNVVLLSGLSDAELRWLYSRSVLLVAPSYEDFGLTPLEAGTFGTPVVALRAGGYLDTVVEGRTGLFFERPTSQGIREAVVQATSRAWDRGVIAAHAATFAEDRFVDRLRTEVAALAASPRT